MIEIIVNVYMNGFQIIEGFYMNIINPTFSIVITITDASINIENTLKSIISQSLNFNDKTEIILVINNQLDDLLVKYNFFKDEYPGNIIILTSNNLKKSYCRNLALKNVRGEYVGFLSNNIIYEENVFQRIKDFFENNPDMDIISINSSNDKKDSIDNIINLNINPNNPLLDIECTFIRTSLAKSLKFNEKLYYSSGSLYLNKLLLKTRKYAVLNNVNIVKDDSLDYEDDINYYTTRLINFHMNLINYCISTYDEVPPFIQVALVKDLEKMLFIEELTVYSIDEDIKYFWCTVKKIFSHIDEDVLKNYYNINFRILPFMMYLKNDSYKIDINENEVKLITNEYLIDSLTHHRLWLDNITIRKDYLILTGLFLTNFYIESYDIYVVINNSKKIKTKYMYYPQDERKTLKFLSQEWRFSYNFEVKLELTNNEEITDIQFIVEYKENNNTFTFTPELAYREITGFNTINNYLIKKDHIIFHSTRNLFIVKYSYFKMLKFEIKNIVKIIKSNENKRLQNIFYRILHLILHPFLSNKKIYLYNDRLDHADDNARYLFEYALSKQDKINHYYIVNNDIKDNLKSNNNVITYGSFKHKILYLFADKLITSFLGEKFYNPFLNDNKRLYSNMIQIPKYFIQHGIIYKDLTNNIKRFNHELELLLTTTKSEYESFFDYNYNYSKDVVQLLGLPRFDKLNNTNSKKQILYCPTWRQELQDNPRFQESTYYHMITDFLNNQQLHQLLKKYDYELVFKPHPELIQDLNKFKIDKNIKISSDEDYKILFNNSKILITDYSSVFFDFAYLEKPIIYYQQDEKFHYDEGYFNYENDGFGDVIFDVCKLINKIESYLQNNCQIENKYLERINKTFKFHDKNNCERVYTWIKNN
ncbi:MAG: glycosyltransferase [Methanosphaera stadtmanae]|jgi:CDP-glycerol glycerophosphotransferase (TagB/SpsB family)|nr:glycosyltransferase [Methanosphaera stadtmanae]